MHSYDQIIIVISAATTDRDVGRRGKILQSMQSLGEYLRQQIQCAHVSPVLQNWPHWQWQLIGEVRHGRPIGSAMQSFFVLDEFNALKAVAATDCSIFRPAQTDVSRPHQVPSFLKNDLIPTCC